MMGNPVLSVGCGFPCAESNICMPWSFFERMKNSADRNDQIFGVMHGIQNENLRGKYRSRKRNRQDRFRNNKYGNDHDQGIIIRSNDGILSPMQTKSFTSKSSMKVPGSNRSVSPRRSPIKSKQSSPLFSSHADMEESMRLHSIQGKRCIRI